MTPLYPKGSEPINHSLFDTLQQVNIDSVLYFVNEHCGFMACFEHILGRYSKLNMLFASLRRVNLNMKGAFFNADSSFDTRAARKWLWNAGVIPNIDENKRGRKRPKRVRKRHFDRNVYKRRFAIERTFAWIDKFRTYPFRWMVENRHIALENVK